MSHAVFVFAAYALTALTILGLVAWVLADGRGRRRDLAELERQGIRRRSDQAARGGSHS